MGNVWLGAFDHRDLCSFLMFMRVVSTGGTRTFFAGSMGTVEVNSELVVNGNSLNGLVTIGLKNMNV
jgi:hypothetical protein